jgi:hypothetical protein
MAFRIEDFGIMAFSFRTTGMAGFQGAGQDCESYGRSGKPGSRSNKPSVVSHDEIGFTPVEKTAAYLTGRRV